MPSLPSTSPLSFLFLLGIACLTSASAQSLPPLSGIGISLSTSATQIEPTRIAKGSRGENLAAQVTLRNRSRQPLSFFFPDIASAQSKFTFSVYDDADQVVWTGAGRIPQRAAQTSQTTLQLAPRAAWTSSILIPLAPSGSWLPPGQYRLEAVLAGTPTTFAATTFEILDSGRPPIVVNPPLLRPGTLVSGLKQISARIVTNEQGLKVIRVSASGWVPHPGYTHPRLVASLAVPAIARLDGSRLLVLDFLVTAPPPDGIYPMVIAEVSATGDFPWNESDDTLVSVTIRSASGNQSAEVSRDSQPPAVSPYPAHWGPVPPIQTMDIVPLPGNYGYGSSTLANWIRQNLTRDAEAPVSSPSPAVMPKE